MSIATNTEALRAILATVNGLPSASSGPVYGKAVFFGDSISVGMNNNDYSFVDILSESGLFESVTKRAYSGATIGPYSGDNTTNNYCFVNQVTRYSSDVRDADIIFIEYGANDFSAMSAGNVLPGFAVDDVSINSMAGCTRKALESIRSINPKARLVWLAFTRWRSEGFESMISGTDGFNEFLMYMECSVYRVAQEFNCGVIDMTDGFDYYGFATSDGVHPTTEGHTLIAQNVVANMFRNTNYPKLSVTIPFTLSETGECTTNALLPLVWGLACYNDIDVKARVVTPFADGPFLFDCVFCGTLWLNFAGVGYTGTDVVHMMIVWNSSGVSFV